MSRYALRHPSGQSRSRPHSGRLKLIRYLNCLIYLPAFIESYGGSTVRICSRRTRRGLLGAREFQQRRYMMIASCAQGYDVSSA